MKTELETILSRLVDLEEAHDEVRAAQRRTAALCEALKAMVVSLASISDSSKPLALKAVTIATDALNAEMEAGGYDDEFQRTARGALERLSAALVLSRKAAR